MLKQFYFQFHHIFKASLFPSYCVCVVLFFLLCFSCPSAELGSQLCFQLCSACPLESVPPCQLIPNTQSLRCLSLSHTSLRPLLSFPLSTVPHPLSPGRPSGSSLVFLQLYPASGLCCVKVLPAVSSLSRPLAIYSSCPSSLSLFLSLCFLSLSPSLFF